MLPPNPAVIEVILHRVDPITSAPFDDVTVRYGTGVELNAAMPSGYEIAWSEREDIRGIRIGDPVDIGGGVIEAAAIKSPDAPSVSETVRIRPLDPYDAVDMAPDAGVPQPLDVVKAHVIRGVMLATQLDAVVAPDNTVVTLIIETGMGTYVRYGGSWLLMPEGSSALEDMALVQVAPSAMAVWDQSDSAGKTVSIADLPTKDVGAVETIEMPGEDQPAIGEEEVPVVAGANIPSVNQIEDLPVAIRYAITHPESRWYVIKRATALGELDKIPQEWRGVMPTETLPEFPSYIDEGEAVLS